MMQNRKYYFNAEMKIDFDEFVGKINIILQDIRRVVGSP
jgi:hypothetical protein